MSGTVRTSVVLIATLSILGSVWTPAEAQSLRWLGSFGGDYTRAEGVSADGTVVVGYSRTPLGFTRAFRWTAANGMQDLGTLPGGQESGAYDVSHDGKVVVGWSFVAGGGQHAFRWTAESGMQQLPASPTVVPAFAYAVSADGSIVAGYGHNRFSSGRAFVWSAHTGTVDLGTLPDSSYSSAKDISADGMVVVGAVGLEGNFYAVRWSGAGPERFLTAWSGAWGVSANGEVIVGGVFHEGTDRAFRWSAGSGMQIIDTLPDNILSRAWDVSADGAVVVGYGLYIDENYIWHYRAVRWQNGVMDDLNQTFAPLLADGSRLYEATAVSPSGRYIVGYGRNATTNRYEAFLLDTCPGGDSDNDCICDDWEREGLDINNDGTVDLNLPALGARVGQRDIFVEYDSARGLTPSDAALDAVRGAFAARGIRLHFIDGGDHDAEPTDWPNVWASFDAFKASYYGTPAERLSANWENIRRAKRKFVRYCAFIRSFGGNTASGIAELPGDDFIVALGHPKWQERASKLPSTWDGRLVRWDDFVAGTLMHELGHTLGLRHGGCDHINYKPNYYSVMNYLWQFPFAGYASSWVLDFSGSVFPTLNENSLSEPDGIGGVPGRRVPVGPEGHKWLVNMSGPVDWNRDGFPTDIGVVLDVNGDSFRTLLKGHNDWNNLDCTCDNANWADGVHLVLAGTEADLRELDFSGWLALSRIGRPRGDTDFNSCVDDADLLAVLFAFGTTGRDLLEDLNQDEVVDDADLLIVLFEFGQGC